MHCDRAARAESRARAATEGWEEDKELWEADRSVTCLPRNANPCQCHDFNIKGRLGKVWPIFNTSHCRFDVGISQVIVAEEN